MDILNELSDNSSCMRLDNTDPGVKVLQVNGTCVSDSNVSSLFVITRKYYQFQHDSAFSDVSDQHFYITIVSQQLDPTKTS